MTLSVAEEYTKSESSVKPKLENTWKEEDFT